MAFVIVQDSIIMMNNHVVISWREFFSLFLLVIFEKNIIQHMKADFNCLSCNENKIVRKQIELFLLAKSKSEITIALGRPFVFK